LSHEFLGLDSLPIDSNQQQSKGSIEVEPAWSERYHLAPRGYRECYELLSVNKYGCDQIPGLKATARTTHSQSTTGKRLRPTNE